MSRRRVVVTGLGCVSPVGNSPTQAWDNLLAGRSGICLKTGYYLRLKNKICLSPFISIACTPYLYSPNSEAVINQTKGLTIKNWTGILTTQIGLTFQIKEQKKDTTNKPIL